MNVVRVSPHHDEILKAYARPSKMEWVLRRLFEQLYGYDPFSWYTGNPEPPEYRQWDREALSESLTHTAP